MARSSLSDKAHKLNAAVSYRNTHGSLAEAAESFAGAHAISKRQAYRYLREAESLSGIQPIPEAKTVFTVKLPVGLVEAFRAYARQKNKSLSGLVAKALRELLKRGGDGQAG